MNIDNLKPLQPNQTVPLSDTKLEAKQERPTKSPFLSSSEALLHKVESLDHSAQRQHEFKLLSKQILEQEPEVITTLEQFAFLQCSTLLKESGWEGGQVKGSLHYWENLLSKWKQGQAQIIDPSLTPEQVNAALEDIQDCKEFQNLFDLFSLKETPDQIVELIKTKLDQKGQCILPLEWQGAPGHFMLGRFRQEGEQISLELMTKGGGAEYQEIVKKGFHKELVSYKWEPVYFESDFFKSQAGHLFVKRLIKLKSTEKYTGRKVEAADLYGLMPLFGQFKAPDQRAKKIGVTPQRSGTCTETGVRMPFYEAVLLDPEATVDDIKRAMFSVKFQSLIDGFRQFYPELKFNSHAYFFLENAAKSHLTRLLKLYPEIISEEEFLLGYTIGNDILHKIQEISLAQPAPSLEVPPIMTETVSNHFFKDIEEITALPNYSRSEQRIPDIDRLVVNSSFKDPTKLTAELKIFLASIEQMNTKRDLSRHPYFDKDIFQNIYLFFSKLPLTSGDLKDGYWDQIPSSQISDILFSLTSLVNSAYTTAQNSYQRKNGSNHLSYDKAFLFEISARAYDIACQLAPRIPELKLNGFGFSWMDGLEKELPLEKQAFYRSPGTLKVLNKIRENFAKRKNNRHRNKSNGNLFPCLIDTKSESKSHAHNIYIRQFIDSKKRDAIYRHLKNSSFVSESKQTIDEYLIEDPEKNLFPKEYYYLQNLAIACHPFNNMNYKDHRKYGLGPDKPKGYSSIKKGHFFLTSSGDENAHLKFQNNFYAENYKNFNKSENEIFITSPQLAKPYRIQQEKEIELPLSKVTMEELALLTSEPKVQITEALNWGIANTHLLRNPVVQGRLEDSLFQYDLLLIALKDNPGPTLKRIHQFLIQAFNHYPVEADNAAVLLWLTQLGTYLDSYIQSTSYSKDIKKVFPDYEAILEELLSKVSSSDEKSFILQHLIFCQMNKKTEQMTEADYSKLISRRLRLELMGFYRDEENPFILSECMKAYLVHQEGLRQFLAKLTPDQLSSFFNTTLENVLGNNFNFDWTREESKTSMLIFKGGDYTINLNTLQITKLQEVIQENQKDITGSKVYQELFGQQLLPHVLRDGIFYILPDENIRIALDKSDYQTDVRIQKLMEIEGKKEWYEYLPHSRHLSMFSSIPIPTPLLNANYQYWISVNKNPNVQIYCLNKETGEYVYNYTKEQGWVVTDPKTGAKTNQHIVYLELPKIDEGFQQFLKKQEKEFLNQVTKLKESLQYCFSSKVESHVQVMSECEKIYHEEMTILEEIQVRTSLLLSTDLSSKTSDEMIQFEKNFQWEVQTIKDQIENLKRKSSALSLAMHEFLKLNENSSIQKSWRLAQDRTQRFTKGLELLVKRIQDDLNLNFQKLNIHSQRASQQNWIHFIKDFEVPQQVILIEEFNQQGEQVKAIKFPRLDLSFTSQEINGKIRLQCDQHPDFYLAPHQDKKILKELAGAFLLEHRNGRSQKVIFPAKGIKSKDSLLSHIIPKDDVYLETGDKPYFSYDIVANKRGWLPSSPRAALYLCLRLRAQKDYAGALEYLHKARKLEPNDLLDLKILKEILIYHDHSPEGAAFDCQLALKIFEHEHKYTKESFNRTISKEQQDLLENFKDHIKTQYVTYQSHYSEFKEDIISIPQYLRLTPKQQLWLTHYLFPNKHVPSSSLSIYEEYKLFDPPSSQEKVNQFDIAKKLGIKSYGNELEEGFIRLEQRSAMGYVTSNFFHLFERARSLSPKEKQLFKADLYYLSRQDENPSNELAFLLRVLAYVCDHSEKFRYIDPPSGNRDIQSVFSYIVRIVENDAEFLTTNVLIREKATQQSSNVSLIQTRSDSTKNVTSTKASKFDLTLSPDMRKSAAFPLKNIAQTYIAEVSKQPADIGPFALQDQDLSQATPIVKKQVETLREGYEIHKAQAIDVTYLLHDHIDDAQFAEQLKSLQKQDEKLVEQLTIEVERLANITIDEKKVSLNRKQLLDYLAHHSKQRAGQVKTFKLEDLIALFLKQDMTTLKEHNPALDDADVKLIYDKILEIFVVSSRVNQIEEAVGVANQIIHADNDAKPTLRQQLAEILNRERLYNPTENPLLMIYEYATGLMLKPFQLDLLTWAFNSIDKPEAQSLLFQMAAGGGKTKVIQPILAILIAQKGYFPVAMNIQALYEIGKRDLDKSLYAAFKQALEVLEIDLEIHDISTETYQGIYEDLKFYHEQKKCLVIKTETLAALYLNYQRALDESNREQVDILYKILNFLETKGVSLIDEGHLSLDSLHEFNIAVGNPFKLPLKQQKLVVDITLMLAGLKGDITVETAQGKKKIQDVIRLIENQQALTPQEDLDAAKQALIPHVLSNEIFEEILNNEVLLSIPELTKEGIKQELQHYFSSLDIERPKWLDILYASGSKGNRELASSVVMIKQFLYEISPYTLHLIGSINYGDSAHPGDLTCAPRHNKQILLSKFQNVYVTMALTVQNILQEGLDGKKLTHLMEILLKEHSRQKQSLDYTSQGVTKAQILFNQWWGAGQNPPSLDHIFLDNQKQMMQIANKIGKNSEVLEKYLLKCALPQIVAYPEKITCTPPNILRRFKQNIIFTATPGLIELYPYQLQNEKAVKLDLSFEASVLQTLAQSYNKRIVVVDFQDLNQVFQQLYDIDPEIIKNLCAIIDLGGSLRAFENPKVIEAFLNFTKEKQIPFTGGIYRREVLGAQEGETGQLLHASLDIHNHLKSQPLKGSDLKQALKQIGKNFDEVLLLTLFDRAITTGADILQPFKRKGIMTVGEDSTKTSAIQAAMRLRKLLLGENGQTLIWLVQKELEAQIPKSKTDQLTIEDVFMWMIENEAALLEKAIVMRAYQGIQDLVRQQAWSQINQANLTAGQRIGLYHQHRLGLIDQIEYDPFLTFGKKMALKDARLVLEDFAQSCANKLGITEPITQVLSPEDKAAYELIIKQTEELIGQIRVGESTLSQHQNTKQEVKQEIKQEQRIQQDTSIKNYQSPIEECYNYPFNNIFNSQFLTEKFVKNTHNNHLYLKDLVELEAIPDNMLISSIYVQMGYGKGELKIKPISYYLIVQDEGKSPTYLVCSRAGAAHYQDQLLSNNEIKGRKAVLVDREGKMVTNGKGSLGFSRDELKKLRSSNEFKERMILGAFLNGQILDIEILKRLIKKNWTKKDYDKVLNKIERIHVGETSIDWDKLLEVREFKKPAGLEAEWEKFDSIDEAEVLSGHIKIHEYIMNWVKYFFPTRQVQMQKREKSIEQVSSWTWQQVGNNIGYYATFGYWNAKPIDIEPSKELKDKDEVKVLSVPEAKDKE